MVFDGQRWLAPGATALDNTLIMAMLPYGSDTALVATFRHGIFLLHGKSCRQLSLPKAIVDAQIYTAYLVEENLFAIGTVSAGIFFVDRDGRPVRHFHTENGMQNNNVLSLFIDDQQNLWAGLDEGIDRIDYNSNIKIIPPAPKNKLPAYAVRVLKGTLFVGTSDGVFMHDLTVPANQDMSLSIGSFERVT
jgi:ligand-binding sensor domain-containing protein